jgi:hypothetical protein
MKKVTLVFLLLFATFVWAAVDPNPEEYPLASMSVHPALRLRLPAVSFSVSKC